MNVAAVTSELAAIKTANRACSDDGDFHFVTQANDFGSAERRPTIDFASNGLVGRDSVEPQQNGEK
jgi:hypothetical protein